MTFLLLVAWAAPSVSGENLPPGRVLIIGIDGLRSDALRAAETPALDGLIAAGGFSDTTKILGDRYQGNDTVSGPGWSSFLTGVWADKHGVNDNSFEGRRYDEFPHLFARIKAEYPAARTGSFVDWAPIDQYIVRDADVRGLYPAEGADQYARQDARIARDAAEFLSSDDPHAVVVYFGAVDETGHRSGFHPAVPSYIEAIEIIDRHVARLLTALRARTEYQKENWLVLVSTDHGGQGTWHGGGHLVPVINTTFLIVSGPAAAGGTIEQPNYLVDLPVTAMVHLGVELDPDWQLDGRPVGLRPSQ